MANVLPSVVDEFRVGTENGGNRVPQLFEYHGPNAPKVQAMSRLFPQKTCFKRFAAFTALVGFFWAPSAQAQAPPKVSQAPTAGRPNILFIYTDDQATWSIGAYGQKERLTPNLDRLAREGMLFQNAFTTTPVCSPSRAGLMTGLYATQVKIGDWLNPTTEPHAGLEPKFLIWPELLKANGYKTMLAGKWHLGLDPQFHPSRSGFDMFYGFRDGGNTPINPKLEEDGETGIKPGVLANLITDKTLDFIKANQDKTWLAAVHFREPHAPYAPTDPVDTAAVADLKIDLPAFPDLQEERVKKLRREYLAAVHAVDRNVGRLLKLINELQLDEKTLVVFTSDHGYMIGEHGLIHKGNASWIDKKHNGLRPNMFDNAIRVPLIVRQPGRVPAGQMQQHVMRQIDFFPTIVEWVGLGMPQGLKLEGRDASELLAGKPVENRDETVFGQYDLKHSGKANMRMIRTTDWKLVVHLEPGAASELYDLKNDPEERNNLWDSPTAGKIRAELIHQLQAKMKTVDDPLAEQIVN